jgi:hypothetical protein
MYGLAIGPLNLGIIDNAIAETIATARPIGINSHFARTRRMDGSTDIEIRLFGALDSDTSIIKATTPRCHSSQNRQPATPF